ncbi:MAG: hypothetical protein KJO41_07060 [Bacteroidia bacterium]|nr:hypothetical protein [Bacteroidia bacterium]MBT8278743.1 hypothetical protein [Bacteroidia bacterium]MBT8395128.1 hypothetical protein [Bacteroidia bacterium]NND26704.1 hypothetical protein [Flavobacteriaceae bacterium]NNL31719.1 hypothetical protein [Flavobacteriaceae bacterium]
MKNLIFLITLIFSINICAQNEFENIDIFVRVYNLQGKKIGKGKILSISETGIQLNRKGVALTIPLDNIGSIKTKRSAGNNVLVGTATGGSIMTILGVATADPDAGIYGYTAGEGALAGFILGGTAGAAVGGITILFKNSKSYEINGDKARLKTFTEMILKLVDK